MIARFLSVLVSATALVVLGAPGVASAAPCGEVRYSSHARAAPPVQASPAPSGNPLEPEPSGPGCRRAARVGAIGVSAAAALGAVLTLLARFLRGSRVVRWIPAGPPSPPPPAPPTLHSGNASPQSFMRMFPELTRINLGYRYPTVPWWYNCQNCCVAAELTFRGAKDVVALPRTGFDPSRRYNPNDSLRGDWRKRIATAVGRRGAGWNSKYDPYQIARDLVAWGDGARAIVFGARLDSTGMPVSHVFNVVNSHGTVFFVDAQIGGWADTSPYYYFEILRTN